MQTGHSPHGVPDKLAKNFGWFSIGLGLIQVLAPARLTRMLGIRGQEGLIRAFGFREIMAGVMCLSTDKHIGIWSRVGSDALHLAALFAFNDKKNPKRGNVDLAFFAVAGITLLDLIAAEGLAARRSRSELRDYSDRTGLDPKFFKRSI